MKRPEFSRGRVLCQAIIGGLLLAVTWSATPVRADDDDWRERHWREHERREAEWRAHERREHWDHRYWDRDDYRGDSEVYVYRPPPVYYAPPPPSGLDFVFRLGR